MSMHMREIKQKECIKQKEIEKEFKEESSSTKQRIILETESQMV